MRVNGVELGVESFGRDEDPLPDHDQAILSSLFARPAPDETGSGPSPGRGNATR